MNFTRTARALLIVALVVVAMLGLTAIANFGERSHLTQETAASAAAAVVIEAEPNYIQTGKYGPWDGRVSASYYADVALDSDLQEFIYVECGEACVDFELVLALITYEHRGHPDPDAISPTNDYGLMQINKVNHAQLAEDYGLTDMLDPKQNIIAGIAILSGLAVDYGDDWNMVLMAYNMGQAGASRVRQNGVTSTTFSESILQIREDIIAGVYSADNFVGGKYQRGD